MFKVPEKTCNAHLHIIDPVFPNDGKAAAQIGTVEMYKKVAEELGLKRAVFVQPKPFALDNTCLLDAIKKFGTDNSRGIAVVNNTVSDAELIRLHEGGVRGLRFSVWNPNNAVVSFADCAPLAERVKDMGWNIQLHMSARQLYEQADVIRKLPCRVVIDHMGRLDPALGIQDKAYAFIREMIDRGNTYVKICGPYLNTIIGFPWNDATETARIIASYAPERVVWGTDWPHVTEKNKLDENVFLELIPIWFPTEKAKMLVLKDNPAELYGFKN